MIHYVVGTNRNLLSLLPHSFCRIEGLLYPVFHSYGSILSWFMVTDSRRPALADDREEIEYQIALLTISTPTPHALAHGH